MTAKQVPHVDHLHIGAIGIADIDEVATHILEKAA